MRIGTWNVQYAAGKVKNERRLQLLHKMDCDIWVLTETHDDLDLGSGYKQTRTIQRDTAAQGGRWTTIWSRFPILEDIGVEDPHRTAAALIESPHGRLLVFGTVLPWGSDRGPTNDAKGWTEHHRVIPVQAREWARLRQAHPDASFCLAGDLNTNLGGKHYYGTQEGRRLLYEGLNAASLTCVTETEKSAHLLGHGPIDHICLSSELAARAVLKDAWEGKAADGVRLSDHSGVVVEITR